MRFRLRHLAVVSALMLEASAARAEPDSFGIGDGHSGPKVMAAADPASAGEVDSYAGVAADVAPGDSTVSITTTVLGAAFRANDLIMVWRATGVDASEAPSGDPSKRLDLAKALATTSTPSLSAGLVGRYELARVTSVAGSVLTLAKPMVNGFTKNVSQVVRVPEYTTVTLASGANMRALPWQEIGGDPAHPNPNNPWVGGILVFFANGAIANDGTIHANARGFHGGTPVAHPLNSVGFLCDGTQTDGDPTATNSAFSPKGEGVVQSKFVATSGGKGNISMAGGGDDCLESGGGGGGNFGNGGHGSSFIATSPEGGFGGVGIDYDPLSRLTMGGGGGAGREVVGTTSQVSFGGFGGGAVYLRGASLAGTGVVQANGGNAEDSGLSGLPTGVSSEGSGGGGAGGTVLVRLTGSLDCSALASNGRDGGNAQALGPSVVGAGGGGGGGRILFQAASKTGTCNVTVTGGNKGNATTDATSGGGGASTPDTAPLCVATAPGIPGSCADPEPVCDPASGVCATCSGPFGGTAANPCPINVEPVCLTSGACAPCNGDFNSSSTQPCQLAAAPTCVAQGTATVAGSCGKCTVDADCTNGPGHPGPRCDPASGACGTPCTKDEDCRQTEWCASGASAAGVCIPKVPNSQPLPAEPPVGGLCSPENGQRTCLSAVCEETDDLCGLRNASPCPGGGDQCRSSVCFSGDQLCGLPNGQPCTAARPCRSALCANGTCTGEPCGADPDCPLGQVCDPASKSCIDGCRPGLAPPSDGGLVNGVCPPPATCLGDGGAVGTCNAGDAGLGDGGGASSGGPGAGDTAGIIEGGGCSCSSTLTSAMSPLSLFGAVSSVLLLLRRRKNRRGGS